MQSEVQRFERYVAGLREIGGAAFEQQRIADSERPLGCPGGLVLAAQEQFAGAQLVDAEPPSSVSSS